MRIGPDATPEDVLDAESSAILRWALAPSSSRPAGRSANVCVAGVEAAQPRRRPNIPADEDELLHASRLVAQRCLYGVDKNPRAVELAKLSLWLATLARDHEFTFLDHALKCGRQPRRADAKQIAAADWDVSKPGLPLFRQFVADQVDESDESARAEIQSAPGRHVARRSSKPSTAPSKASSPTCACSATR